MTFPTGEPLSPLGFEQTLVGLAKHFEKRAYDDTTATECQQWLEAKEHLEHAANCMSVLDHIAQRRVEETNG